MSPDGGLGLTIAASWSTMGSRMVTATNWVNVTVFNDVPRVSTDSPHINMFTSSAVVLNWTITDRAYNATNYTVYQSTYPYTNVGVNRTGTWTSGTHIQIDLSTLSAGNYNFTIIGWDGIVGGNFSSEVDVYVSSNPPPAITAATTMTIVAQSPLVVVYMNATTGHGITWTITDSYAYTTAPFTVYQDNVSVLTGNWVTNHTVSINVDGLAAGNLQPYPRRG